MQHLSHLSRTPSKIVLFILAIFYYDDFKCFLDCNKMVAITTVKSVDWFQDEEYFHLKGFLN